MRQCTSLSLTKDATAGIRKFVKFPRETVECEMRSTLRQEYENRLDDAILRRNKL